MLVLANYTHYAFRFSIAIQGGMVNGLPSFRNTIFFVGTPVRPRNVALNVPKKLESKKLLCPLSAMWHTYELL